MTIALLRKPRIRSRRGISSSLRKRADCILGRVYAFIDSPALRERGVEARLFDAEVEMQLPPTAWYRPTCQSHSEERVANVPTLLTIGEEALMFHRMNYAKLQLTLLQRRVSEEGLTAETAKRIVEWHGRFVHFREHIVRANLGLVLAMARRMPVGDVDYSDIVSEGNMALLRAVEKFNADRGFKFSTYACRAIIKSFFRAAMTHTRRRTHFPVGFDAEKQRSDWTEQKRDVEQDDAIDELKQVVDRNLANLSDTERLVIHRRFNWNQDNDARLTLEEVGQIIGLTKERVRQIQKKALAKIRELMQSGVAGIARTASSAAAGQDSDL